MTNAQAVDIVAARLPEEWRDQFKKSVAFDSNGSDWVVVANCPAGSQAHWRVMGTKRVIVDDAARQCEAMISGMSSTTIASKPTSVPTRLAPTIGPTETPIPRIGERVVGGNWAYTVTRIERQKRIGSANAKGEWVVVYITLEDTAKRPYEINSFDFSLLTEGDVKYGSDKPFDYQQPPGTVWLGQTYPPGVPFNATLVFDINPGARQLRLWLEQEGRAIQLGESR